MTRTPPKIRAADVRAPLFYGWVVALVFWFAYGVLMGFPVYAVPVINPYLVKALSLDRETLAIMMGAFSTAAGLLAPAASLLVKRFGSRITLLVYCGTMLAASLCVATWVRTGWQAALCYGVLAASTTGSAVACQSTVARWFVRRRGFVMAAVVAGAAMLGSLLTFVLPHLIAADGWQAAWWLAAALAIAASIVVAAFVKETPAEVGRYPDGASHPPVAANNTGSFAVQQTLEHWTIDDAVRTKAIWLIIVFGQASLLGQALFFAHAVVHLRDLAFPVQTAAMIVSVFAISTLTGKILSGLVADHIEPRVVNGLAFVMFGLGLMLLIHPGNAAMIAVAGACIGIPVGAMAVCEPLLVSNYYGATVFPLLLGLRSFVSAPLGALVSVIAGWWFDRTGSYTVAFGVAAGLLVISGIALIALVRPPRRQASAIEMPHAAPTLSGE